MQGRIHAVESFGTVDGPGIRLVIFLQGCPLRCVYCHNPDSHPLDGGEEMTVEALLELYRKNRAFYQKGGITLSGGEPLLQAEFATELFARAHAEGIHTALDTSGITFDGSDRYDALLANTDLVLLDIKAMDEALHRRLTGADNQNVLAFARYLAEKQVPVWLRHVVVPGYNDDRASLEAVGRWMATLPNVSGLEVLPYHTMGVPKYKALGRPYPLEGVPPLSKEAATQARKIILSARSAQLV